ncbi:MAG: FimB/Mfa2 family fimbrial subunit [Dysgonomonas mossii]|uniref:FimB/Mfa2 family fimbrial subunit n=1 Tax=Dysgonomonas mossii TaxID=163665 RepID=UPI001D75170E|nr:FimB/Mfa2 family fimbrial subunit [Dysgonomonas mossii]MBS7112201.1 FimB/Mfa2 family fimbrial subunit [Dysgonomonas mossii]
MGIRKIDTRQKNIIVLLFLAGILFNSCRDNEFAPIFGVETKEVTFSVKIPGVSLPKTKSLNENNENEVRSIEVLLFDNNGEYTYQPIYSNVINTDEDDINIKTFTIKIPEGTYNMLIFANTREAISAIINSIEEGDTKTSVLDKLVISNNGKWNTDPVSTGYTPIPMFGEIPSITVNAVLSNNTPVNLVRMVSKIDVALTNTDATDNFTLESIRLYNYNNKGYIAPVSSNWDQTQSIVTDASIPAGLQALFLRKDLYYTMIQLLI